MFETMTTFMSVCQKDGRQELLPIMLDGMVWRRIFFFGWDFFFRGEHVFFNHRCNFWVQPSLPRFLVANESV